jgi:hypothetical protein
MRFLLVQVSKKVLAAAVTVQSAASDGKHQLLAGEKSYAHKRKNNWEALPVRSHNTRWSWVVSSSALS